jgi:hypothetical protein
MVRIVRPDAGSGSAWRLDESLDLSVGGGGIAMGRLDLTTGQLHARRAKGGDMRKVAARMLDRSLGAGAIQSTRLARTPCANPAARCALVDPPVTCRVKRRQLGWLRTGPSIGDAQAVGEVAVREIQPRN